MALQKGGRTFAVFRFKARRVFGMSVVTIDGPAGAGKSTVSKLLAERLGWQLLDTGAMYRAVTLAALRRRVDLESDDALGELARSVTVRLADGRVWLDDEDISGLIRSVEVTRATSQVADSPGVRERLVAWQREFADEHDVIAEVGTSAPSFSPTPSVNFTSLPVPRNGPADGRGVRGEWRTDPSRKRPPGPPRPRPARRRPRHRPDETRS